MGTQYIRVSVYPDQGGGWSVALALLEPGKPYPRLKQLIYEAPLPEAPTDLAGAVQAAAQVLLATFPAQPPG